MDRGKDGRADGCGRSWGFSTFGVNEEFAICKKFESNVVLCMRIYGPVASLTSDDGESLDVSARVGCDVYLLFCFGGRGHSPNLVQLRICAMKFNQ